MPVRLLLLVLLLPSPLCPGEAPAVPPATTTTVAPSAPVFTDAEWQRSQGGAGTPAADGGGVVGKAATGLVLSLLAIIAVAGGLAWAARRFGVKRVLPGRGRHLTVIETVPLGFKRSVSLVRIGDQVLVVGQGEHDLTHLATLPVSVLDQAAPKTPPATEAAPAPAAPAATPPSAFRALLDNLTGRRT